MNHSAPPPPAIGNNNPYIHVSPVHGSSVGKTPLDVIFNALNRCGQRVEYATRKAEAFADNVLHHLNTSPSPADAAMARLAQGTKVVIEGGYDNVFRQVFGLFPGEKLLKAYACYLSTSSGPAIGTVYISNKRIAFCSDHPLCSYSSGHGQQEWMYYKVVVQLHQVMSVTPSANMLNPADKYIHVVTRDGHEFWFMGFISYDKALKNLTQALQSSHG